MRRYKVIIIMLLGFYTTISMFPSYSYAIPENEKEAFCLDRYNPNLSLHQNTQLYNDCKKNAEEYIKDSWNFTGKLLEFIDESDRARERNYRRLDAEEQKRRKEIMKVEAPRIDALFDAFNTTPRPQLCERDNKKIIFCN